ncbi:hypothetical protein PV377_21160 [Streptomyces ipomoeae]|uniref:hypothetical protein n=1 Tax=Streptomyces ipomoeae TaxID=103232 RepID=UPI00299FC3D9|nr:hypothetical protein [Streptomyces ipomoeae]MDX2841450.1 hypothetical protein [Streptomyces ipomoeae]
MNTTVCPNNPPGHDWDNGLTCRWCDATRTPGEAIVSGLASRRGGTKEAAKALLDAHRAEVLREALEAVEGEQLHDDTNHPEDKAYRQAIDDAVTAVSRLAGAEAEAVPLVVARFDTAMEPAPEEKPVFVVGAIAENGRPVALCFDPEGRRKVAGWLAPSEVTATTALNAAADEIDKAQSRLVAKKTVVNILRRRAYQVGEEATAEAATATPFFQPGRTYTRRRRDGSVHRFTCEHLTTDPQTEQREAWGWLHRADGTRRMERMWDDDYPKWTPEDQDSQPEQHTEPASFFQKGRTYTRQCHGDLAEFDVRHIEPRPDGSHVAFGFYRRQPRTAWHPYSSDDFHDGWTDAEAGDAR